MKKILFFLFLLPFIGLSQGIKVKALPTIATGSTNDYLIKDDAAGISGSTKIIKVGDFITTYSIAVKGEIPSTNGLITTAYQLTINGTTQNLSANRTYNVTAITGNSGTSTKWFAPININGIPIDGSANITIATGSGTISGSGTVGYLPFFITNSVTIGSSIIYQDNFSIGINQTTPTANFHVVSTGSTSATYAERVFSQNNSELFNIRNDGLVTIGGRLDVGVKSGTGDPVYNDSPTLITPIFSGIATGSITGNAASATKLQAPYKQFITGDITYSVSIDGSGNVTAAGTLATVATAGTYGNSTVIPSTTINTKGLVTSIATVAITYPTYNAGTNMTITGSGFSFTLTPTYSVNATRIGGSDNIDITGSFPSYTVSLGGTYGTQQTISRVRSNSLSLTTASYANIGTTTFITVTSGTWLISGNICFQGGSTTGVSYLQVSVSKTSASEPVSDAIGVPTSGEITYIQSFSNTGMASPYIKCTPIPPYEYVTASSVNLYLTSYATFTNSLSGYGFLNAFKLK